jgi:hypothetical protein
MYQNRGSLRSQFAPGCTVACNAYRSMNQWRWGPMTEHHSALGSIKVFADRTSLEN